MRRVGGQTLRRKHCRDFSAVGDEQEMPDHLKVVRSIKGRKGMATETEVYIKVNLHLMVSVVRRLRRRTLREFSTQRLPARTPAYASNLYNKSFEKLVFAR